MIHLTRRITILDKIAPTTCFEMITFLATCATALMGNATTARDVVDRDVEITKQLIHAIVIGRRHRRWLGVSSRSVIVIGLR
jgi:hypothetical protein